MQDAAAEFAGTSEEVRVMIANADMAVLRGDLDGALATLKAVAPSQPFYAQAREAMASIYLHHRKNKRLYTACYRELMEQTNTAHACILLGDAYMNVQEPERAIAVYESALKKNPRDGILASKIGAALTRTHDFTKAINYYEAAVRNGQTTLRYDLAELYLKLNQLDKAEKTIHQALEHEDAGELPTLQADVKYYTLMARVHQRSQKTPMAILVLAKAREAQARVLQRVGVEQPDALRQEQQIAADICFQVAELRRQQDDPTSAVRDYQEALTHDDANVKTMLALARLYLASGDLDAAMFQLTALLRVDKSNNDATMMIADVMFGRKEFESAIFHFQQLLEREPQQYEALARLVDLLRRAGKLDSCPKFLEVAEKASAHPSTEPGLNFCKGLHARYTHQPNAAIKHFNLARKDADWGVRALYNMVEICLNPDSGTVGGETFEATTNTEAMAMGVRTAEKLLQELAERGESGTRRFAILRNYALLASGSKPAMERALAELTTTTKDTDVPGLLALSRACMLLKQAPKARTHLKRISELPWHATCADEFEGAWLLLADIHIQGAKVDLAQPLLKMVLTHNKSCAKAWEYMGFIMEKEQSFTSAAEFYENAWTFCSRSDPAVGFKLAFNHLKSRRFVEAIDVAQDVLKSNPDYPRIRKEILERARGSLRP